mmetsp:Transcript_12516/g.21062  ORF Transcript_12516/g.21062 Transcript_12516/m.21062 type:complete len:191 (+) Transcript_12516:261-833(+)
MQSQSINKSFSKLQQKQVSALVQEEAQVHANSNEFQTLSIDSSSEIDLDQSISTAVDQQMGTKAHSRQLVSEVADQSEDNKDDLKLQVPLTSRNDAVYMGTIYMGSPTSQPTRVVFDTGSEYLAVTSALCDDKTSGNFKFKKYDPLSGSFVQRDQLSDRCNTRAYNMHQSDSNKILSKASSKLTYGSAKL